MSIGACAKCGKPGYLMPLHGAKGGPLMCFLCSGAWHAEHGKLKRAASVVIKAMRAYSEAGGNLWKKDEVEKLRLAAAGHVLPGYEADARNTFDVADITAELLADAVKLTHPDRHPPERAELAKRVTAELLALKPFVFPAPKPKPIPKRANDASVKKSSDEMAEPSLPPYPCRECRDALPSFYCDPCKIEHEKREQLKRDDEERARLKRNEFQRERYAQQRRSTRKKTATCIACGGPFEPPRRDAKYCSARCRQRAYVKRDVRGTNERPLDASLIEQRIFAVLAAEPDGAWTTAELCDRVFPGVPRKQVWHRGWVAKPNPAKSQRAAVIAAAKRLRDQNGLDWLIGEGRGSGLMYFRLESLHGYCLARLKGDWLHANDSDEEVRGRLLEGGKDHHLIVEGGAWRRHWAMHVAESRGETDTPHYKALKKEQDAAWGSWS